jgi:hypothetical protein
MVVLLYSLHSSMAGLFLRDALAGWPEREWARVRGWWHWCGVLACMQRNADALIACQLYLLRGQVGCGAGGGIWSAVCAVVAMLPTYEDVCAPAPLANI